MSEAPTVRVASAMPPGRLEVLVWRLCRIRGFHLEIDLDEQTGLDYRGWCSWLEWPYRPNPKTAGPPRKAAKAKLQVVRDVLVKSFGDGCAVCSNPWARIVDHDHFTGQVRGYLCLDCNNHVDMCRHLSGCGYAEYLNNPPAVSLGLVHPDQAKWQRMEKYVGRKMCFDIVMAGGISPGFGIQTGDES